MSEDKRSASAIHAESTVTSGSPDALVYYCAYDGRVKRVKPRELDQVEHGGTIRRYCKQCGDITLHVVMTAAEAADPAHQVEALIRCLNDQGVIVRKCPRDVGFYGVQINRYNGSDDTQVLTGTEAMLYGPVTAEELVPLLLEANELAQAPDSEFTHYRTLPAALGRSLPSYERESRMTGGGITRLQLWQCYGLPPEVGQEPYPPLLLFAEKLRDALTSTERTALALVLTGRDDAGLDMSQVAVLQRPAGINVTSWPYPDPDQAVRVRRDEVRTVLW